MRWTVKFCSSLLVSCTGASPSPHVTTTRTAADSLANRWLRCKHAENTIQHCGRNSHGFPQLSIVGRWRQSNRSLSLSCTDPIHLCLALTPICASSNGPSHCGCIVFTQSGLAVGLNCAHDRNAPVSPLGNESDWVLLGSGKPNKR